MLYAVFAQRAGAPILAEREIVAVEYRRGFVFEEAVVFDSEMDPDANWFYTVDYNMARESFKSVTSQEATDFIEDRESHVTRPDYTPFTDYPSQSW